MTETSVLHSCIATDLHYADKLVYMSNVVFKNEEKISRSEISDNIRKIADGIDKGEINLKAGEEAITLMPSSSCEFEIKVEEEADGELSLELEIEWNKEGEDADLEIG